MRWQPVFIINNTAVPVPQSSVCHQRCRLWILWRGHRTGSTHAHRYILVICLGVPSWKLWCITLLLLSPPCLPGQTNGDIAKGQVCLMWCTHCSQALPLTVLPLISLCLEFLFTQSQVWSGKIQGDWFKVTISQCEPHYTVIEANMFVTTESYNPISQLFVLIQSCLSGQLPGLLL